MSNPLTPQQMAQFLTNYTSNHIGSPKPQNPTVGQIYFDHSVNGLMIWCGAAWEQLSGQQSLDYALMLDDERDFDDIDVERFGKWDSAHRHLARSVEAAKDLILTHAMPKVIFFDHDLGDGVPDATKFMWWLIDGHLDSVLNVKNLECVVVHSANPVGAERLIKLWEGFRESEGIMAPVHRIWPGEFA